MTIFITFFNFYCCCTWFTCILKNNLSDDYNQKIEQLKTEINKDMNNFILFF